MTQTQQDLTTQAITAISQINDPDQLSLIVTVLRARREIIGAVIGEVVRIGQMVQFNAGKGRGMQSGVITKVNPKKCLVRVDGRGWAVPHEMLRLLDTNTDQRLEG